MQQSLSSLLPCTSFYHHLQHRPPERCRQSTVPLVIPAASAGVIASCTVLILSLCCLLSSAGPVWKLHHRSRTPRRRQHPLLRRTSLSLHHLTVTYGEWYDFHNLSSLDVKISPTPPMSCPSCPVYIIILYGGFYPRFPLISQGPTRQV